MHWIQHCEQLPLKRRHRVTRRKWPICADFWTSHTVALVEAALRSSNVCHSAVDRPIRLCPSSLFQHYGVDNINTYMDVVIGYISECISDIIHRTTVQKFHNYKPWFNVEVWCVKLGWWCRKCRQAPQSAINSAKKHYRKDWTPSMYALTTTSQVRKYKSPGPLATSNIQGRRVQNFQKD